MIDPQKYSHYELLSSVAAIVKQESNKGYLHLLDKVVDNDDSPDLTGIHPKDRPEINLYSGLLYGDGVEEYNDTLLEQFTKTLMFSEVFPGIVKIELIAIGPHSCVPVHLDDMSRAPFDNSNEWYAVLVGVDVPSSDFKMLGVQIGNEIYNHMFGKAIVFDTQIPHSAFNNTDQWWLSLRYSILKQTFRG